MAANHTYSTYSINGKTLHILKTAASNIKLINYAGSSNWKNHSDFGFNSGNSAQLLAKKTIILLNLKQQTRALTCISASFSVTGTKRKDQGPHSSVRPL